MILGGQAPGFGRNQAPKTDRLKQVPSWEFRNRRKSFTPLQLARILWDFAYLCWANPHWRRQAFGEGSLQRKLIWIQPYKTAGSDA